MDTKAGWLMVYSSILSMQFHPGVKAELRLGPLDAAKAADYFFNEFLKRERKGFFDPPPG